MAHLKGFMAPGLIGGEFRWKGLSVVTAKIKTPRGKKEWPRIVTVANASGKVYEVTTLRTSAAKPTSSLGPQERAGRRRSLRTLTPLSRKRRSRRRELFLPQRIADEILEEN